MKTLQSLFVAALLVSVLPFGARHGRHGEASHEDGWHAQGMRRYAGQDTRDTAAPERRLVEL